MFIRQIYADSMLAVACAAPLLAGTAFHFGIPRLEKVLEKFTGMPFLIRPYYLLADLFLCILTPFMFCFASSMVILEERDEGVGPYMMVTPVGKKGYILSRLVIPALLSSCASAVVLLAFGLSGLSYGTLFALSLFMPLVSVIMSVLITSISSNRVEGMAMAKLSGLILAGLAVPFFVQGPYKYLAGILPTFWIAEYARLPSILPALAFLASSALWLAVLYPLFRKKGIGG